MDEPPSYTFLFLTLEPGVLYIFLAALLIFFTSLTSAAEAAFFSLRADDLDRLRDSSEPAGKKVAELQTNPRLLLTTFSACKYTLISGAAVLFVFFLLSEQYPYGRPAIITGTVLFTAGFVFLGVIVPKTYGRANNYRVAKSAAGIVRGLVYLYRPLVNPLFRASNKVEVKLEEVMEQRQAEEFTQAIQQASASVDTSESEREILQGIVNFGTLTVRQVMRLRSEISYVEASMNFDAVIEQIRRSGYSRIPVCRKNLDTIEGVLYAKDLLPYIYENSDFKWQELIRPAYYALDSRKIDHLLKDFQEKRVHLALVVDEYGTLIGLISLEDIIEEIIGDINDEFDEISSHYQKIDSKTFLFDGKTSMHDFCKVMQAEGPVFDRAKEANKSIGGMLRQIRGPILKPGEPLVIRPFTFTIEKMDNRRIRKVRVQIND